MPQTPRICDFFAFNCLNYVTAYTDNLDALESVVKTCERFEYLFSRTFEVYASSAIGASMPFEM